MSDLAAASMEVNGFKANPLESSQFLRFIEWQKALVSNIKANGAATYFTDTFSLPTAAQDESELGALQSRYSRYLSLKLKTEEREEELAADSTNLRLQRRLQVVVGNTIRLAWRKTEKQQMQAAAVRSKLSREVSDRVDKACGKVHSWIESTVAPDLKIFVDDITSDERADASPISQIKSIRAKFMQEMQGSLNVERERLRTVIREYPEMKTYAAAREGLMFFSLKRQALTDNISLFKGNGTVEDDEMRTIFENKLSMAANKLTLLRLIISQLPMDALWPAVRLAIKTELDKHVPATSSPHSKGLFDEKVALTATAAGTKKPWRDLSEAERELARKANAGKECSAWKRFGSCRFGESCMFKHDPKSKRKDKKKGSANVVANESKEEKKQTKRGKEKEDFS